MIKYPKQEDGKFFYHTVAQKGDVVIKILASTLKKGRDVGGFAAKADKANADYFVYKILNKQRKEQLWTVEAKSQVGGELAKKNVMDGDVIKIHFLGMTMPTDYGMKAKYEILKKGEQPTPVQAEPEEDMVDTVKEVFGDNVQEEVNVDDFD
jgi:hypothetical protein